MNCPCHNCEERTGVCHDVCEKYRAWRANRNKLLDALKSERDMEAHIGKLHYDGVKRARRGQ